MPTSDSPAVARYRVRHAIRAARDAMGLTQTQVARAMDWSLSKVMRIENGDVNITPNDLKPLLELLNVTDAGAVERLMDGARRSRQERWTVDPEIRKYFTPAMIELYQFEEAAVAVRNYQTSVIPGVFQTDEYALVVSMANRSVARTDLEARIGMRLRRARSLLRRPDGPAFITVLDESVLHRPIGGARVIADALDHFIEIVEGSRHRLRILPFTCSLPFFYGPFELADLDSHGSALLYRERDASDELVHSDDEIQRHREVFESMCEQSLGEDASLLLMKAAAARYRAQQ